MRDTVASGLPHSEISGSKVICTSPELIAAYHVLRRLLEPRHPPYALAFFFFSLFFFLYWLIQCLPLNDPLFQNVNVRIGPVSVWNVNLGRKASSFSNLKKLQIFRCQKTTQVFFCKTPLRCSFVHLTLRCASSLRASGKITRKEVFQPHLPVRLPCYDLAPIICFTLDRSLRLQSSGAPDFHGLTGGVYKARERIHRAVADARLLANPASWSRVADSSPN